MSDQIDKWKDDVGPGWLPLIEVLDRQLRRLDPDYRIEQVKEKFGGLRYYIITSEGCTNTDRMYAIIDTIESLSFRICEDCGRPGEERENGWIRTLCDECEGGEVSGDLVSTRDEMIPYHYDRGVVTGTDSTSPTYATCVPVAIDSSRFDKIRAVAQQAHDNGDCVCCLPDPDTITITISREAAKFVRDLCATLPIQEGSAVKVVAAIDASLEGER